MIINGTSLSIWIIDTARLRTTPEENRKKTLSQSNQRGEIRIPNLPNTKQDYQPLNRERIIANLIQTPLSKRVIFIQRWDINMSASSVRNTSIVVFQVTSPWRRRRYHPSSPLWGLTVSQKRGSRSTPCRSKNFKSNVCEASLHT